jgi:sterol desaturase/sphingolipid hydroxylase (fatty acid hydroxylase superfamily)
MAYFIAPCWLVRTMFKGLIVFPLEGHCGYGNWNREDAYNHYLHHSRFNLNYGSSPMWDYIMSTNIILTNEEKQNNNKKND